MEKINECDLYEPVKNYLHSLGYDVKAEVNDCDISAIRGDELIVVELKTGFTLELVYQALRRLKIADSVYVAVPLPKRGYMAPRFKDTVLLCKQLGIGLIFVGFTINGRAQIDVAVHPQEIKPVRKNNKKRIALINEHSGRTGSVNIGGVSRRKIMTVYKEQALKIADILKEHGSMRADEVKEHCGFDKTSTVLTRNFYKWYEKEMDAGGRKNTYKISEKGLEALAEYRDLIE